MESAARPLLATMPLHAITATYGEDGLRERFSWEIATFPESDRRTLERALALASRLHATDRRQREPYVNHLLRVATRIICYYNIRDPDVICAALLHDAVEDHPDALAAEQPAEPAPRPATRVEAQDDARGEQQAALAVLAREFGFWVAELVAAVTNPPLQPGQDAHQQYREHVAASLAASPWARIIKVSDFTDNGVGLIHTTGPKLGKLASKYAPLIPVLRDLIARPDTPLDDQAKQHILGQLDLAAQRLSAIQSSR